MFGLVLYGIFAFSGLVMTLALLLYLVQQARDTTSETNEDWQQGRAIFR